MNETTDRAALIAILLSDEVYHDRNGYVYEFLVNPAVDAILAAGFTSAGTVAQTHSAAIEEADRDPYEYAITSGLRCGVRHPDDTPGWEVDMARGINGWKRFDYYEERYWKRLKV